VLERHAHLSWIYQVLPQGECRCAIDAAPSAATCISLPDLKAKMAFAVDGFRDQTERTGHHPTSCLASAGEIHG
jgi:hypothetical protein